MAGERRGYYSEIATAFGNVDACVRQYETSRRGDLKKPQLLWQMQSLRHAPVVKDLPVPPVQCCLQPAKRWVAFGKEKNIYFPVDTFKPKVQIQYKTEPRELPREVQIERLRREYMTKCIETCVRSAGIEPKELIPVDVVDTFYKGDKFQLRSHVSFLPLELFDNCDFDIRNPSEWMSYSTVDGIKHSVPAKSFLLNPNVELSPVDSVDDLVPVFSWTPVSVESYDEQSQTFNVLTLDGHQRHYDLPRINVMFLAEDPSVFTERLADAIRNRRNCENRLRFEFYLDCMPLAYTDGISQDKVDKVVEYATRGVSNKYDLESLNKLVNQIQTNHKRTICSLQFRRSVLTQPDVYDFVELPEDDPPRRVPRRATQDLWGSPQEPASRFDTFAKIRDYFQWYSIYVMRDVFWAMKSVAFECMQVGKMNLFQVGYNKHKVLEEFEAMQTKSTKNVLDYLQYTWMRTITNNLRMHLRQSDKGWCNLHFTNPEIYDNSKMFRIMKLVKLRMEGAIRDLVTNSIESFVNFVETPCQSCLHVCNDFVWGDDLLNTQFKPATWAIFTTTLQLDETGAFYSTAPEKFGKILLSLFDTPLYQCHKFSELTPVILERLKFAPDLYLSGVGLIEDFVCEIRDSMLNGYEKAIIPLLAYASEYNKYVDLYKLNINEYISKYREENHPSSQVKEDASYYFKKRLKMIEEIPASIVIGPFYVHVLPLKTFLVAKQHEVYIKLLDMYCERMKENIENLIIEYKKIMQELNEKPHSVEQIYEIREWMETIPLTMKSLEDTARRYYLEYDILDYFWYNLPQEDFEQKWEAVAWPQRLNNQINQTDEFLDEEMNRFYTIQVGDEAALYDKIEYFTVMASNISGQKNFDKIHDVAVDVRKLWKNMKEAQELGMLYNARQKLFNVPVVPFDSLTKLIKEFEPYKNLWVTASDWLRWHDIWMDNPLVNIDGEAIERTVNDMYKTIVKAIRMFSEMPLVQQVGIEIKSQIEGFRPLIPLIQAIRSPGMRERHWEDFRDETGINIAWSSNLTFNNCLELGVSEYAEAVTKIADNAAKEYSIEVMLAKMREEWEQNKMELQPYKNTGTYIVKLSDEILQMLDDHIVMTQQLSFSPFKGAFEQQISDWEEELKLTANVIDEWIELQKQWMYLEPIFTSEDITTQLPIESKKYKSMERTWRRIMRTAIDIPLIIEFCPDKKLLESLRDAAHLLEMVEKGLADYLETKRTCFPRLFFLSDDELLEILSQARNPRAVQPHLRKCFENIAMLEFEEDMKITKMYSADEEGVKLNPALYPEGGVENWLVSVESSMRNTIRTTFGDSMADMPARHRNEWVLCWPGQIVIAGCQTYWTAEVERAIASNALGEFFAVLLDNLEGLRSLVKGQLTNLQREVLSALIVIEVHSRDVTKNLVDDKVINVNDFEWIKQLRYYWIEEELKVRAVNAEFSYGYEYLGNSGRLVITPLTDRCYLTLTGALHLKFGGAPAGPAGTGKTETTKDLAKAFAIQCVVFNCSDQLDFMAMGKFFKGLASSGAWACFDEFNRIDIEVLSVVAQQITTIQKAQQAHADRFLFEGVDLVLKQSCAVFITMNPGYAGRTELPDNLKALFRPVAMMVPNYSLIAEISLFSFGFGDAKQMAEKITTTFKLSSEQLSTQDHYDFGMRAVKTVIAVAGNLKREKPDMDERQIVLRSLRDVNVPKFLKDDLKLFNGIVSDLFPRMEEIAVDYGILEHGIRESCRKMGLEDVDDYVLKVIQLYDTTVVRHGLMLVGPTGSGKTKCYEILQDAMTCLKGQMTPGGYPFQPVHTYVVNPKSITMGQLYGEFDLATHEWTDGILSSLVRFGSSATDKDKRWYVFDGPVDAVWIENMNTVLDDNKKLCLSSGEIIKLKDSQTMMFEVADLAVASPATVSRCGMVYLEPGVLGLRPYLNCWIRRLPQLAVPYGDEFQKLFDIYLIPALELLRSSLREIVTSVDSALVQTFLRLLDYRLVPLMCKDNRPPPPAQFQKLVPELLVPWVAFSLIWSVGCTCEYDSRVMFSNWVRTRMLEQEHAPRFPAEGLVYDYKLHDGGFNDATANNEPSPPVWYSWMDNVDEYTINPDMKYSDIEVPTIDNVRNAEMIGTLLLHETNVLCVGPTGTGKTLTVLGKLSRNMPKKFICDFIAFSARTSANQTQDLLDSKLDRRRKGVFGPPVLKRQVFFIDDLNMPALEVFGAQPPIELIRQWMDFGGWYDRKQIGEFRYIIDVNFVAAMGPPGGGRNPVTARLLRHFHYLTFTEMEDSSKLTIFGTILESWLSRTPGLVRYHDVTVNATLAVYKTILEELLPTPAKTHYTFNLRDLSKVFQGLLMMDPEKTEDLAALLKLWYHENCRVYQDRLVTDADREWFEQLLRAKIRTDFNVDDEEYIGDGNIMFGDFMDRSADVRQYVEIVSIDMLSQTLNAYLEDYNNGNTSPMKLVLFSYAMSHVAKISRIIRQPMGNALLLGVGGSGRQSLTRLAAYMAEYRCYQIELSKSYSQNDWKDDIKSFMLSSGLYDQESVFLFSDTQIKSESFLEDLNNILNSGDVPNIYQPDELDKIYQNMKGIVMELGLAPTKSNLFSVYRKQEFSPIGEIFRARLRQFPALVNCCTIDWFCAWPESALQSVALQFLEEIPEIAVDTKILHGIVLSCQHMHASVAAASELYLQELSRHNYVTPTSYLELLSSYSELMTKKKNNLQQGINRLRTGLDKLLNTSEEVKVLQAQLEVMKPALEIAARDAEVMIEQIAGDTIIAEETKSIVEKEEMEAHLKSEETQMIAQDAQQDLDKALPALLEAEQSLKSLNKNDITEVRVMKRPPAGVVFVIEAICIVKEVKPNRVPGKKFGEKVNDYWEPGRGMLSDPGQFLQSLMNFDKESITESMVESLRKYVENPDFQPAKIITVSKACTSLCMWVHAIYKYYFINKIVAPKKAALARAKDELEVTERALAAAKQKMKEAMDGLEKLNMQLEQKVKFKEEKENGIKTCEERMNRAVRLINGLADERVRWLQTIDNIEHSIVFVTGDILICSGAVAYLTPFTDAYRRRLLADWAAVIDGRGVPHSVNYDPVSILGEPVAIRKWQLEGLPRDTLSTENAILVAHSRRWPLFIDPQGQANKWIKNMGKDKGINICKLTDKELIRTLESAIRFGKPILIENVGTELDPALDPILLRSIFKQSGQWMLKLGDNIIPYNDDFRLYITTKLPNPHYTPEVSIKVLVVNFTLVSTGLLDQLLGLVVMQERPDLEEARSALVISSALMKHELKEIEDRILHKLSASEGSPIDDIDLIVTLEASKIKSDEIKLKVESAEITQQEIDKTRAQYIPVANRGQILFFCLADLSNVDPMYQYSLEWFVNIFIASMANTEKSDKIEVRITTINDSFTFNLFGNVCRSLFEKHKMQFAFLICVRILMDSGMINPVEWHHFLAGASPAIANICREPLPKSIEHQLSKFQKLLVLKCLRPDKVTDAMQDFLTENFGQRFIEPQTTELSVIFQDSNPLTPLIFVLSAGTDPAADLYKFADKMRFTKKMLVISLGQGQGPRAEKMIEEGTDSGFWVFFQNCHLAPSFMPRMERLIENIPPDTVHRDFRIWLTSTPSPHFPSSILQNGSKMTIEPPRGVKANMMRAYTSQIQDMSDFFHSEDPKVPDFKWLLFSLCLFHGVLLERRKFGPLGFNIPYEFTNGDLKICISQLYMFLMEYTDVPYKVLVYTAGHINYGGRVTDDWDRRCMMSVLHDYYKPDVIDENYVFDEPGNYHQLPSDTTLIEYLNYIRKLPINDEPSLFGLHYNADISCAQAETYYCLSTLLALQPKIAGDHAQSQEEVTKATATNILEKIPNVMDLEMISAKYPVLYNESLNTVLVQEVIRYNKLLRIIQTSLKDLLKALKGLVVMSEVLEDMALSLFSNAVPGIWSSKAYPSLKPLGAWVIDLNARVSFLRAWIDDGIPEAFWISGFYFPQAFLTGTLQNYARKYVVSIDTLSFSYNVLHRRPHIRPDDGCCIYGLFLEGAKWNADEMILDESNPKELYTDMSTIWMIPEENHTVLEQGVYECPVYKTLTRAGTLSTTGHSTNYVVTIEIPCYKPQEHWIKRGVALICALDY